MGAGRVIPARGQGFETVCIVQQTEGKRRTKNIKSHKCDMTKKRRISRMINILAC